MGCGDKGEDTAVDTAELVPEDEAQALYGVADVNATDDLLHRAQD